VFSHLTSWEIYHRSGKAVGDDLNGCCRLVFRFWFLVSDLATKCSLRSFVLLTGVAYFAIPARH
jgi:hypothetical protein